MKKTIILSTIVLILGTYLFWSDFRFIKKFVGYNASEFKEPETVSVVGRELSFLDIPEGFEITVVAKDLENPRVILFDPKGRILISETKTGRVSVLEDPEPSPAASYGAGKDNSLKMRRTLIDGLKSPHGLAFYKENNLTYLYIAETHQVARYAYDINAGRLIDVVGKNITSLPADGGHFTRTIAFGPNFRTRQILEGTSVNTQGDKKLYISVGSSCDVCEERTWKRATILESDPEGSYTAEFAGGLRNSVFFTFHPKTKEIWATDMGRDNLGDNLPPDEVNIVKVAEPEDKFGAKRYGWPFCYGNQVRDKTFNPDKINRIDISSDCSKTELPIIQIPAHSAPLGLAFVPSSNGWPKEWESDLLVVFHGSWNSSVLVGYKVVRYNLDENGNVLSQKPEDFISGWLGDNGKISGRPVDLKFGSDGSLYISDDSAGVIYRVTPK